MEATPLPSKKNSRLGRERSRSVVRRETPAKLALVPSQPGKRGRSRNRSRDRDSQEPQRVKLARQTKSASPAPPAQRTPQPSRAPAVAGGAVSNQEYLRSHMASAHARARSATVGQVSTKGKGSPGRAVPLSSIIRSVAQGRSASANYPTVTRRVVNVQAQEAARRRAGGGGGGKKAVPVGEGRGFFCYAFYKESECPRGANCPYNHFKPKKNP